MISINVGSYEIKALKEENSGFAGDIDLSDR